jgi:hypothetical protein
MIKYWSRLLILPDGHPAKLCYLYQRSNMSNSMYWTVFIKSLLDTSGFVNVWINENPYKNFLGLFKRRIVDIKSQELQSMVNNLIFYKSIKINLLSEPEDYVKNMTRGISKLNVAKFRTQSHSLNWKLYNLKHKFTSTACCTMCSNDLLETNITLFWFAQCIMTSDRNTYLNIIIPCLLSINYMNY